MVSGNEGCGYCESVMVILGYILPLCAHFDILTEQIPELRFRSIFWTQAFQESQYASRGTAIPMSSVDLTRSGLSFLDSGFFSIRRHEWGHEIIRECDRNENK